MSKFFLCCFWIISMVSLIYISDVIGSEIPIDDFETITNWSYNPDGGIDVKRSTDTANVKSGKSSMRLIYSDKQPHWGNIQSRISVPPNAFRLDFWLYKYSSSPDAAMHVWLFEPDGDGWLTRVTVNGKIVGNLKTGWHHVELPIGAFRFQPRGNRRRRFLSVNKILIGCNFGDLDVCVDAMKFITKEKVKVQPPPRTENLTIQRTDRGSIAILKDDMPVEGIASSPDYIASVLRDVSYGVTFVKAGDIIDSDILNRKNFDALILCYGASYPASGRNALIDYLKSGGNFLCTGGYAFDNLIEFDGIRWSPLDATITADQMDSIKSPAQINTRYGRPGDTLGLAPDQIGVFDPSYVLDNVAYAETAPGQYVLTEKIRLDGELKGFAATAMTGSNSPVFPNVHARWIPIINAYDAYSRLRGSVGSIIYNYAGPYAGSSWAIFGVTNRDLFSKQTPAMKNVLIRTVEEITSKTFLHELDTEFACYHRGEPVRISVKISNFGNRPRDLSVSFAVESQKVKSLSLSINPGETKSLETIFTPGNDEKDFYSVSAALNENGRTIDEVKTAFVVWNEKVIKNGLDLKFRDNYFTESGRPTFFIGTNQTGMMWYSANENPLVWERDFAKMQDCGIKVLRILHFSPFSAGGYRGRPRNMPLDLKNRPEKLIRQTDAIVQLAQKHKVVLFLSLHDWMRVELSDEELEAQRSWNEFWAKRYAAVPGIMYDIQNEPGVRLSSIPDIKRLFNNYLKKKYGTLDNLRRAWHYAPPKNQQWDINPAGASNRWDDVKAFDINFFKVIILNRWVRENVAGVRAGDPDALVTVGYLPSMPPADKILGVEHTDFSNMHYYGSISSFPRQFKIIDRRFAGKSFSLGEFGAQEAHNHRTSGGIGTRDKDSIDRFLATTHYAFGLGASFVANWDWKDFNDCVFPWGLNHPQDFVSKKLLLAYRDMGIFLGQIEPKYEDPGLYILIPDSHRLGGKWREVHNAIFHSLDLLLGCHVNFNVINEFDIEKLPPTCKAILWPIPYCPGDDVFEKVYEFVKKGGALYLSGDIAYDPQRKRTRTERLSKLKIPDTGELHPFTTPFDKFLKNIGSTGILPVITSEVGEGRVFFVSYPLEIHPRPENIGVYKDFLTYAGVKRIHIEPDIPTINVFSIPTIHNETAYVFYNADTSQEKRDIKLLDTPVTVELTLRSHKTGFVLIGDDGRVKMVEAQGVRIDSAEVVSGGTHVMIASVASDSTEDAADIRDSRRLMILPFEEGNITITSRANWKEPVARIGETINDARRDYQEVELRQIDGKIKIKINRDRLLSVIYLMDTL